MEAAVEKICEKTCTESATSSQAQTYWEQWAEDAFPELDSRAYFLPPVHFNRVPTTRESVAGQKVLVLQPAPGEAGQAKPASETKSSVGQDHASTPMAGSDQSAHRTSEQASPLARANGIACASKTSSRTSPVRVQNSDVRHDGAMQRVLLCLQKMSEENKEVLVGLSQFQFGQYLGEPCYAAAAAQLPRPENIPPALPQNWTEGEYDLLIVHRHYGIVVCQVKAFGDNLEKLSMPQQDIGQQIRKKLKEATKALDKAEDVLSYLVSDIAPGLRITKTIGFPNLSARQVQEAVCEDNPLTQKPLPCLGTPDSAHITGLCLCSDQLSDPKTPWDVSSDVLGELHNWWQRCVAVSGPDRYMTSAIYKTLVARFCGPATTVTVPCTSPPRLSVKTLGQAVSWTGECYTAQITLFPEQVNLINMAPPRVFVAGPPGTGKTVVLLLMGTEWLRRGHDVSIVSTCRESRAACRMLHHLLQETVSTQLAAAAGRPHLVQYDYSVWKNDGDQAASDLSRAARDDSLYVIADEVEGCSFPAFCRKLLSQVPRLHLWAASYYHRDAPEGWQVEDLTRPLRSPPVVLREVQRDEEIRKGEYIQRYKERSVADHTDGPPVRHIDHNSHGDSQSWLYDCVMCGREVASFLRSLRVGAAVSDSTASGTLSVATPPTLQWRDVLMLCNNDVYIKEDSAMLKAMIEDGIPLRLLRDDIDDMATARSDVVWVAGKHDVRGLERKVVVCLENVGVGEPVDRLHKMSRCTSQLVIVSNTQH